MKKIVSAQQMQQADLYTIQHEPISSLLLMERAAKCCFNWIRQHFSSDKNTLIFCGTGNNGGDGLVIADYLLAQQENVSVYILLHSTNRSIDFSVNEKRILENYPEAIFYIHVKDDFPEIGSDNLVIDAIFGTGLNKPTDGLSAALINHINEAHADVIAIDLPSGLFADKISASTTAIIKANHTLTFQLKKTAFYFPSSEVYTGKVHVMDIRLLPHFFETCSTDSYETEVTDIHNLLKTRNDFSHKGTFGHALLMCGSYGKMGAAVLAAQACLRSGVGLLTTNIPKCGYTIMQTNLPEAMVITDEQNDFLTQHFGDAAYTAIGIGCGIGNAEQTIDVVAKILETNKPLVLDADALNCISSNKTLLKKLPASAILTPHFKEFERLTEKATDDFHRNTLQRNFSINHNCFVVLKGRYTCISTPEGKCYFNPTGNAGMATAGSGDVLTGIITGLLAQGYLPLSACIIAVYIHGMAGDYAAENLSQSYMMASDIVQNLATVFKYFENQNELQ